MNMNAPIQTFRRQLLRRLIDERADGEVGTFAKLIGVKNPSQLSQYLGGHRNLGDAMARKIETRLGLKQGSFDLPTKGGDPCAASAEGPRSSSNVSSAPGLTGGAIPLLTYAPAGPWMDTLTDHNENNNDTAIQSWLPPPPTTYGPATYALKVEGDSMISEGSRSYPPGCLVYVDPDQRERCQPGSAVIARLTTGGEVVFKLLAADAGRTFLRSLHRSYPPIHEPFEILGKVIGSYVPESS